MRSDRWQVLASDLKSVPPLALGRVKFRVNLIKCPIGVAFSSPPHLCQLIIVLITIFLVIMCAQLFTAVEFILIIAIKPELVTNHLVVFWDAD